MPSRRCGDRSSSIVQFSASVIVSALVFDHSREATQCLQHTTQPHLPSLAGNHMCEVVLWHCHLSAGLLCAVCFLMSFHFTISQATDSILWLKSVILCEWYISLKPRLTRPLIQPVIQVKGTFSRHPKTEITMRRLRPLTGLDCIFYSKEVKRIHFCSFAISVVTISVV